LRNVTVLLISAAKPCFFALYDENGEMIEQESCDKPLTESLYVLMSAAERRYSIKRVLYVNGPGSFMGLKLGFVFMRTFALAREIDFAACDSFAITGGAPVFSHKNRWFVKNGSSIELIRFENPPENRLIPPKKLNMANFSGDTTPCYLLPAV
jgi:tRNA A37 threonylcarbamoyladenosine modification protein TsaB